MKLEDALFNWLQIKLVADARPEDQAAKETELFFHEILTEDHGLTEVCISHVDSTMCYVSFIKADKKKTQMFDRQAAEQLLIDIHSNPKYNE
jgi:hypothetical protein